MIGIARTCRSRPSGCCGDRDGWGGGKGLHIPPRAYGEGQERPHHPAEAVPWWSGERLCSGGMGSGLAPALFHRHWGCELGVAGARHE